MGNILGGGGNSGGLSGSFSGFGGQSQCCDAVVDPITLLTVIGAIAGLAQFLRQAVIDNMIAAGRKRSTGIFNFVLQGNLNSEYSGLNLSLMPRILFKVVQIDVNFK